MDYKLERELKILDWIVHNKRRVDKMDQLVNLH